MKRNVVSFRANAKLARQLWGELPRVTLRSLRELTARYSLSVAAGDLQLLDGRLYVTHSGLLQLASRKHCAGIKVEQVDQSSDPLVGRWVFKATVFKSPSSKGFVGLWRCRSFECFIHGARGRVADCRNARRESRPAQSLRDRSLLGRRVGCVLEPPRPSAAPSPSNGSHSSNGSGNGSGKGQPRLRDQLCLLIRQYNLDPNLVKAYAADFCGTEALSGASRELVESFISHLSSAAKQNRDALVCKLNSYAQPVEARS